MYILDTNVISELRKAASGRADKQVTSWAMTVPTSDMFMSVVSLHELELGVLLAERNDKAKGRLLRTWLDSSVLPAFASRILPVSTQVARIAPALHVPDPAPFRDALIAATAFDHQMTVATRNTSDFERFSGLQILNPWD